MKLFKLDGMVKGWFVGNFEPAVIRTDSVEVGVKYYKKGDIEKSHHHKLGTEITVFVSGSARMRDRVFTKGDVVVISPNESTDFECLEDNTINVVVKLPSAINDKYLD